MRVAHVPPSETQLNPQGLVGFFLYFRAFFRQNFMGSNLYRISVGIRTLFSFVLRGPPFFIAFRGVVVAQVSEYRKHRKNRTQNFNMYLYGQTVIGLAFFFYALFFAQTEFVLAILNKTSIRKYSFSTGAT